jgi:hypothetical protein
MVYVCCNDDLYFVASYLKAADMIDLELFKRKLINDWSFLLPLFTDPLILNFGNPCVFCLMVKKNYLSPIVVDLFARQNCSWGKSKDNSFKDAVKTLVIELHYKINLDIFLQQHLQIKVL